LGLQRPYLHGKGLHSIKRCQAQEVWCKASKGNPLGYKGISVNLQGFLSCLQKKCPSSISSQVCGSWHPTYGFYAPMKAQARLISPNSPLSKVLQRQMSVHSKGLKSNVSWQVKSHLIQEKPKLVHQNYTLKLNKCSKTLCNLPSLGMGRLSR
jgi:hypothetical protein